MILTEILLKGLIRLAISITSGTLVREYIKSHCKIDNTEMKYAYPRNKQNIFLRLLPTLLYFIPVVGTIVLSLGLLGSIGMLILISKQYKNDSEYGEKIAHRAREKIETPEERLKNLQKGQEMYKTISDELKIEGLSDKEIKKFMVEARKEDPYLNNDNTKEINKDMQRVENLNLLRSMKDYLKNPDRAYKFCLDKKIQFADVNDDTVTIGVSVLDDNYTNDSLEEDAKIYTKKFKLKNRQ